MTATPFLAGAAKASKPRVISFVVAAFRAPLFLAPRTTEISRRPPRLAEATRLYPDQQVNPVLTPSAP